MATGGWLSLFLAEGLRWATLLLNLVFIFWLVGICFISWPDIKGLSGFELACWFFFAGLFMFISCLNVSTAWFLKRGAINGSKRKTIFSAGNFFLIAYLGLSFWRSPPPDPAAWIIVCIPILSLLLLIFPENAEERPS